MTHSIKISAALLSAGLLAGCEHLGAFNRQQPPPASTFCNVARGPIYWAPGDTRGTKEQVDQYNRVGKRLCGWGKKK